MCASSKADLAKELLDGYKVELPEHDACSVLCLGAAHVEQDPETLQTTYP